MADTKETKRVISEAMRKLYLTLATFQNNTIFRVMKGDPNDQEVVARAEKAIEALQSMIGPPPPRTCPAGYVWDEYLQKCV